MCARTWVCEYVYYSYLCLVLHYVGFEFAVIKMHIILLIMSNRFGKPRRKAL